MLKKEIVFILLTGLMLSNLSAQEIKWTKRADLPKPMRGTAVTCNNRIYFAEANIDTSGIYEYEPFSDSWTKKTNMITRGWNVNLAEIDDIIYVIGGDPFLTRNESYDPANNSWHTLSPMPTARQHSNCCVLDGKIYVIGGITSWTTKTDKNEVYNPKTDSWRTLSQIPIPTENPIIASINMNIYALCGNTLRVYYTSSDKWELRENCPAWISVMFGCAVISDKLIIVGGQNKEEEALSSVYIYDTKIDKWSKSTDLPKPIQLGGITTLNDKLYVIGGCNSKFEKYDSVYEGILVE